MLTQTYMSEPVSKLRLALLRCSMTPESPTASPNLPSVALRGYVGKALFERNCFQKSRCEFTQGRQTHITCQQKDHCLYYQLFASQTPRYVLRSLTEARLYSASLPLSFELILLGQALEHGLSVVQALSDAQRALFKSSSLVIESFTDLNDKQPSLVFKDGEAVSLTNLKTIWAKDLMRSNLKSKRVTLKLELLSPLFLTGKQKKLLRQPSFLDLTKALLSRLERWAQTEGLELTILEDLLELAQGAHLLEARLESVRKSRFSKRQQETQWLGGIVGSLTYKNVAAELIPYLKLAEYLHLGKDTTFGLGQVRLIWWEGNKNP